MRAAGLRVLAADGRAGVTLDDPEVRARLGEPTAWLFGNEAWGLPPELLALADEPVAVPIYGRAESLNLAAAAAVCLYASARCTARARRDRASWYISAVLMAWSIWVAAFRINIPGLSQKTVYALESDHNPSPDTVTASVRLTIPVESPMDSPINRSRRPAWTEASLKWTSSSRAAATAARTGPRDRCWPQPRR